MLPFIAVSFLEKGGILIASSCSPVLSNEIFVPGEPVYCRSKAAVRVFKPTSQNLFHDT